ncbi:MAG TPA: CHASE domain-containing protein [Blastocatellia bacterium]|nr:CHASE domain-containing protein [Blastocatellia bacterium]
MKQDSREGAEIKSPGPRRARAPFVVLAGAVIITLLSTYYVRATIQAKDRLRFQNLVQTTSDSIQNRLETYIAILRATSGLFAASGSGFVTREEFGAFISEMELQTRYPGIQGVGFTIRVRAEDRARLVAQMRERGQPEFKIWPEQQRDEYHSIIYLEPMDSRNRAAIGFDMFTEPVRREAMERARDRAAPAASGKVRLVQEIDEQPQAGFLIYYPFYVGGGLPRTESERRDRLVGFVYSPFRADDLLKGIFGAESPPRIDFKVFDSPDMNSEGLLHDSSLGLASESPRFTQVVPVEVAGRNWSIAFTTRPEFDLASGSEMPLLILVVGLVISGVLFAVTRSQTQARAVAERAAETLRASEERFNRAFHASPVSMSITRLADGKFINVNDALLATNGYSRDEFVGRTSIELGVWAEPEDRVKVARALAEHGTVRNVETRFRMKSGEERTFLLSAERIELEGELCVLMASIDITERKLVEVAHAELLVREQEARREAVAANRMKDEFLATVSHELRTPLTSMLGWSKMLRMGRLDEAARARAVESIERNARLQAQIIDDLLDVSRIITGNLKLNIQPTNLTDVIEAAIDAIRPAAEAKRIVIEKDIDAAASPASGDPNRLQQVVWNLLANAVKFTPQGGHLYVAVRRAGAVLEIEVTDSGQGIDRDFLPFVFDRFRQADSTISRKHGGLGLGLSIVRHIVELHGGTVRALSEGPGKGATFIATLPAAERRKEVFGQEAQAGETQRARSTILAGLKVLVVEDEPDTREMISMLLAQSGATVTTAPSARAALDSITSFKPDILVSDIGMPDEDGHALIRKVRAMESPEARLPAIALTAYAREEDRQLALANGYQLHVAKPVDPQELIVNIASLAGRARKTSKGALP